MTADRGGAGSGGAVARLTWQAPDPTALADDLRQRLGVSIVTSPASELAFLVPLGNAVLDLVPWQREASGDEPQPGGRLVLEPVLEPGQAGTASQLASPVPKLSDPADADLSLELAGIAWATVDLDRAARELGPWLRAEHAPRHAEPMPLRVRPNRAGSHTDALDPVSRPTPEPHLGARAIVRATNGLPGEAIVLAEPTTEGRLAASLARHDEGPVALYLRPAAGLDAWVGAARARQVSVSARRDGPLGPQVLVLPAADASSAVGRAGTIGAAMVGPHLIVVGHAAPRCW